MGIVLWVGALMVIMYYGYVVCDRLMHAEGRLSVFLRQVASLLTEPFRDLTDDFKFPNEQPFKIFVADCIRCAIVIIIFVTALIRILL